MKIIDDQLISGVVEQAKQSPRLRMNYRSALPLCSAKNFHESLQDKCHRFLNALEPGTFIPVHHHPDKDETFVILKGKVRVTTYKDNGKILASCVISQESGTYGVDIPKNVWHGLECLTPAVLLECKAGPFIEHEVDGIKSATGSSPQQIIQERLIGMAKDKLQSTSLSVKEIAYSLGYEYPQYFVRLFRQQMGQTPTQFRASN